LLPSIEEGIKLASIPRSEVAALCRQFTSEHTVLVAPSVATTVTCSARLVAVGAVVIASERLARLFPPNTEVGINPTLTPSKFVAATFKHTTSVHVEVGPPLVPEMVTGVAKLVAVGVIDVPAESVAKLPPSTEVGMSPTLTPSKFVAAALRHTRSVQVDVDPPLVPVIVTG
jgi:hypothetical protein